MPSLTFALLRSMLERGRVGLSDRRWYPRRDRLRVRREATGYVLNVNGGQESYVLEPAAFRQLCDRFGISAQLAGLLEEVSPLGPSELLDKLLWNDGRDTSRALLVRLGGPKTVRAVLSTDYLPFDAVDVFDAVVPLLEPRGWAPFWYEVGERFVRIDLVRPGDQYDIAPSPYTGDIVRAGISLVTSEVGDAAVQLAPILIRGRSRSKLAFPFASGKASFTHRLDPDEIRTRLQALVLQAIPYAGYAEAWRKTHGVLLTDRRADHHLQQWHLPGGKSAREAILDRFEKDGRPSLFRLATAAGIALQDAKGHAKWRCESDIGGTIASYLSRSGVSAGTGAGLPAVPALTVTSSDQSLPDLPL